MALTKYDIVEQIPDGPDSHKIQSAAVTESFLELINTPVESGADVLVSGPVRFTIRCDG